MPRRSKSLAPQKPVIRRGGEAHYGVLQLPARPVSSITIQDWNKAVREAEAGRYARAFQLNRASLTQWGEFRGLIDGIVQGILGLPILASGGTDAQREALLGRGAHSRGDLDRMLPRDESGLVFMDAITGGIGLGQMCGPAEIAPGQRNVPRVRHWDPQFLRQDPMTRRWFLMTQESEIQIEPGDGEWLLVTPYGTLDPVVRAPWIFSTLAFVFWRDGLFDMSRHSEVMGPIRAFKATEETTEPERKKALEWLNSQGKNGRVVLPKEWDYDVKGGNGQFTNVYQALMDVAARGVQIGYTGQTVSTTGAPGIFADMREFLRLSQERRRFYARTWTDATSEQVLSWWAFENAAHFGASLPPDVDYDIRPPEDVKADGEALSAFAKGWADLGVTAKGLGVALDPSAFIESLQRKGISARIEVRAPDPALDTGPASQLRPVAGAA